MKLSKVLDITDKKQRVCVNTKKKQKYYESPKDVPSKYGVREVIGQRFNKETETLEFCIAKKGAEDGIKSGDWTDEMKDIVTGLGIAKKGSSEELESYSTDQNKEDKKEDNKDNDREERVPKRFQKNNGGRFNKNNRDDREEKDSDTEEVTEKSAHHRNNNRRKNTKPAETEE